MYLVVISKLACVCYLKRQVVARRVLFVDGLLYLSVRLYSSSMFGFECVSSLREKEKFQIYLHCRKTKRRTSKKVTLV